MFRGSFGFLFAYICSLFFLNGCGEVNVSLPLLLKNHSSVAYI